LEHSVHTRDKFLFSLISKGDRNAFNILFEYYYSGLTVYANQFLNNLKDSEEIVQDTFLKIWESHEKLHIHSSVRDYLFKAVKNKCLDFIKHQNVSRNFLEAEKNNESVTENYNLFVEHELREMINATLDKLPVECRKVFVLSRIQDLKYKEIAKELGISVKTVENQISKALKIFRKALKDYL
jgi:RNA polymerase sigma-70 factor (ECF subfamily)